MWCSRTGGGAVGQGVVQSKRGWYSRCLQRTLNSLGNAMPSSQPQWTPRGLNCRTPSGRFDIVIDEKSMVSLQLTTQIDQRLRSAAFERSQRAEPLGGMNILLCGDLYQLTPAGGAPLFHSEPKGVDQITGKTAYHAFDKTITLSTIFRQQGSDQEAFRHALEAFRLGITARSCSARRTIVLLWRTTKGGGAGEGLHPRWPRDGLASEIVSFKEAVHLFLANRFVNEHNHDRLRDLVQLSLRSTQCTILLRRPRSMPASSRTSNPHSRYQLDAALCFPTISEPNTDSSMQGRASSSTSSGQLDWIQTPASVCLYSCSRRSKASPRCTRAVP